ncbi:MAG: hypothetical protein M3Q46_10520 [Verrucomicrobiota bacterium]|nr:hypothetical protein [Verrucomicrobiota bacterium]
MSPRKISQSIGTVLILTAVLHPFSALSLPEPQGQVLYQQPLTSFAEVFEYRSFQQDNSLYATLVTASGERKQLKAGGVLAVLPYPPPSFDAEFASTATSAIAKIDSLARTYPAVQAPLEKGRGKWTRALNLFKQRRPAAAPTPASAPVATFSLHNKILQDVRVTHVSAGVVTLTHASGVTTLPIAELTPAQILELNRHSSFIQLPLSTEQRPAAATAASVSDDDLTAKIGSVGRRVANFCATQIGIAPAVFDIWAYFVVLPGLVLLLLLALTLRLTRGRAIGIRLAPGQRKS